MKVVIVTTWFPTGAQPTVAPFVVAHAEALASVGHQVEIVHCRLGSGEPAHDDVHHDLTVARLPFHPRVGAGVAHSYSRLRALLRGADVVHSMAFSTLGVLAPLYPAIRNRWIHTEHWNGVVRPESVGGWWPTAAPLARRLLRLPQRVTAVTSELADAMAAFARLDATRVVPCVVDDSFAPGAQPSWEPIKLVAVGGLIPRKQPLLAVDTVRALVDRGVNAELTWVGGGLLRETTIARSQELGLSDRVRLIGPVMPDQVADRVREANLFFLPTQTENFLTSAAEAIACGRPVVLPNTGGFTDYVNERNGIIAAADDADGFADAIVAARDRFKDSAPATVRDTVIARFSPSRVGELFNDVYAELPG